MIVCIIGMSLPFSISASASADTSHIKYEDIGVEPDSVPFDLCESTDNFYHHTNTTISLDTQNKLGGLGSVNYQISPNNENFVYLVYHNKVKNVDASNFSHIEMDVYFDDVSFSSDLKFLQLELSSEGECDVAEISFFLPTDFNVGWNHLSLELSKGNAYSNNEKVFNKSRINYLRIYGFTNSPFTSFNAKLDNIYFTKGNGGSVPNQPVMMGESVVGVEFESGNYSIKLDSTTKVAGNSSVYQHSGANSSRYVMMQYSPAEPINAGGLTHFEMDIFIENAYFLPYITQFQFELCSGGKGDCEELSFNFLSQLKAGWNHIVLPLANGTAYSSNGVPFDITRFNYLRLYMFYNSSLTSVDINLRYDNMSFTDGNGVTVYRANSGNYKNTYTSDSIPDFGDIDANGEITAADALMLLQSYVGKLNLNNAQYTKADVDNDKEITTADSLNVLHYFVQKITQFESQKALSDYNDEVDNLGTIGSKLIHTKYYTDKAVVADADVTAFGAYGDGIHDDYMAFQAALDYAEFKGDGTIFVPVGTYKISRALRIAEGVCLVGDSPIITDGKLKQAEGTILYAYSGRGKEDGENFIQTEWGAEIHNLSIYYPEQDPNNIVPYSYTIAQMKQYGISVNNVNLVNSYNGIRMGHNINALQNVVNVSGCILNDGILLDHNVDICRMQNIHFSPDYWIESGLVEMDSTTKASVKKYTYDNAVGFKLQHIDWIYLSDIEIDSMYVGVQLMQTERSGQTGGPNGHVYNFNITNCGFGIYCEYVNAIGMMFTNGYVDAYNPFHCGGGFSSSATINSTTLVSKGIYGVRNEGAGDITMDRCTITNLNSTPMGSGVSFTNGSFAVTNTTIQNFASDFELTANAEASKAINVNTEATLTANDSASLLTTIWDDEYITKDYTELDYNQALITRPAADNFIDITTYEYSGDTSKGIAGKLQAAIDELYAQGGGLVYVPSGRYTLETNVVVKAGVEVRGSANAPHHSQIDSTIFFTDFGRYTMEEESVAETATALFTLESRAGISGFKIARPRQFENETFVPYSYTIRGEGKAVYVNNVTDCNAYYGLDLFTNKCDVHAVSGYNGAPLKNGVVVGGQSTNGIVKNCQQICHFYYDNPYVGFQNATLTNALLASQVANLETYVVKDTINQILFNNFSFGNRSGIVIDDGANAFILAQGSDHSSYPLLARGNSNGVDMINTQLVVLNNAEDREYIRIEESFEGDLNIVQTNMWGSPINGMSLRSGNVSINQGTMLYGYKMNVRVYGDINLKMSGLCFRESGVTLDFFCNNKTSSVVLFGNRFAGDVKKIARAKYLKTTEW